MKLLIIILIMLADMKPFVYGAGVQSQLSICVDKNCSDETFSPTDFLLTLYNSTDVKNNNVEQSLPHAPLLLPEKIDRSEMEAYQCNWTNQSMILPDLKNIDAVITNDMMDIVNNEGEMVFLNCFKSRGLTSKERNHSSLDDISKDNSTLKLAPPLLPSKIVDIPGQFFICRRFEAKKCNNRLHRSIAPRVVVQPQLLMGNANRNSVFRCRVEGTLNPVVITWYRNGRLIENSRRFSVIENGRLLEIRNVQRHDVGMYQCFARIDRQVYEASAELRIGETQPKFTYRFIQQTLTPGPAASLKCISRGVPTPTITWSLDGFPLPQSDRFLVGQYVSDVGDVISHVNISRTRVQDGGLFSCKATNTAGSISHQAALYIYGPPYIRRMGEVTGIAGNPFRLRCPVAGYPVPKITWTKGGQPLPISSRWSVLGPELRIAKLSRENDAGQYACTASDKRGNADSQTVYVKVIEAPRISPFYLPKAVISGSRVAVQCVVAQGDPPVVLEWQHEGRTVKQTPGIVVTPLGEFILALIIEKVGPQHQGNYSCKATSKAVRYTDVHSALLRVHVPPYWKEVPKSVDAVVGQKGVQLSCKAVGLPVPNVSWKRIEAFGHSSHIDSSVNTVVKNGSLLFPTVTVDNSGQYMCEASNGIGADISAKISLNVFVPPSISVEGSITARKSNPVSVSCRATGDRPLMLSITKYGQPLEVAEVSKGRKTVKNNLSTKEVVYSLKSISPDDAGEYICIATNQYGTERKTINVVVQDIPSAPRDLRVLEETSRRIKVGWGVQSSRESSVDRFVLQFRPIGDSWNGRTVQKISLERRKNTAEISDLLPSKGYQVRVIAVNNVGESIPSEALTVNTAGEPPSSPPQNLRALALSSQTINLRWSPPEARFWNGQIQGYYVGYKDSDHPKDNYKFETVKSKASEETIWEVDQLSKYHRYTFVVQAFNDLGPGPLSEEVFAMTLEDIPEAAPSDIKCNALTSSRLEISWRAPGPDGINGNIINYSIMCIPNDPQIPVTSSKTVVAKGLSMAIGGLEKFANYSVSVAAATKVGVGKASELIYCSTEEDVPGPPGDIKAVVAGPDRIIVAWLPPIEPNGIISKYTLYTHLKYAKETTRREAPAQTSWMEVSNLTEGQRVQFWVTASTKVGEGAGTKKVIAAPTSKVAAGVYAVNKVVQVENGNDASLPCLHVNSFSPRLKWIKDGKPLQTSSRTKSHFDGVLVIRDVQKPDSGNYTCQLTNKYGSDQATFALQVLVSPAAPRLERVSAKSDSVTVSWYLGDNGGSPITRLVLTWRKEDSEWNERILPRYAKLYTIENLPCGSSFKVYLTSHNVVGPSLASEIVILKTRGGLPNSPSKHRIHSSNDSFASIDLRPFNSNDCPIEYFHVKIKPAKSSVWSIANERIPNTMELFAASGLIPDTSYEVKIEAINPAGKTTSNYSFRTMGIGSRGTLVKMVDGRLSAGWEEDGSQMLADPALIAPILVSVLAICIIIVAIGVCLRKKPIPSTHKEENEKISEKSSKTYLSEESNSAYKYYGVMRKTSTNLSLTDGSVDTAPEYPEDIRPYATFKAKTHDDSSASSNQLPRFYLKGGHQRRHGATFYPRQECDSYASNNLGRSVSSGTSDYAQVKRAKNHRLDVNYGAGDSCYGGGDSCYGGADSEIYGASSYSHQDGSVFSNTDTEFADNASRLDDNNVTSSTAHHNLLYVASDASTFSSSTMDRKSISRKVQSRQIACDRPFLNKLKNVPSNKRPPEGLELSETECDQPRKISIYNCDKDFTVAV